MSKMGREDLNTILEALKKDAKNAGATLSENYKQKTVYNLLNAIKVGDQNEFLWVLLRAINDPTKEEYAKFANSIKEVYEVMPREAFEKWGYAVILGLMSGEERGE